MPRIADAVQPVETTGTPISSMAQLLNSNLARQGAKGRANMMPPTSIMDERYPAWKRNQEDAEKLMLATDLIGSAIPLAGPAAKGAVALGKYAAPQIAQGLENYAFRTGMALPVIDTTGLPNMGRDLIRSKANELADTLNKQGFQATAEYSGSAAGPSAYVNVFDPQTGRFITSPARISGHSKGPYQSQFVHEISDDPQSTQRFVDLAMEMRAKGPTELMQKQTAAEQTAMQMRYESAQKKLAKGKSLTNSEQEAVTLMERQAGRTFAAPQDEALRLAQERAALPVEQGGLGLSKNNTAEQRAAAMGFDKPAYHATDADILAFNNAKLGTNTAYLTGGDEDAIKSAMRGHWFSDRDLTNKDPRGYVFGDVSYPVKLANPKVINDKEFQSKSFIVKDPDNIRSRFAAFDPFRRNAAIAAAMGVAAPDLLAQERTKIKDLAKTK